MHYELSDIDVKNLIGAFSSLAMTRVESLEREKIIAKLQNPIDCKKECKKEDATKKPSK